MIVEANKIKENSNLYIWVKNFDINFVKFTRITLTKYNAFYKHYNGPGTYFLISGSTDENSILVPIAYKYVSERINLTKRPNSFKKFLNRFIKNIV
jgi:hypothetical protein